jgi:antitoxin VapB
MGLKIENEKTDEAARESDSETVEERLRKIRAVLRKLPPAPPGVTSDHSDFYDENGLPI